MKMSHACAVPAETGGCCLQEAEAMVPDPPFLLSAHTTQDIFFMLAFVEDISGFGS